MVPLESAMKAKISCADAFSSQAMQKHSNETKIVSKQNCASSGVHPKYLGPIWIQKLTTNVLWRSMPVLKSCRGLTRQVQIDFQVLATFDIAIPVIDDASQG